MKWSSLRWWRERGWLQSTSPTVSPARTTLTSPSASTSEPVSAVSWSSSSLFRRQKQGESVVSFSGSWEAIKFTNRSLPPYWPAKYNFPYFPSRAADKWKAGNKKSFLIKREVGLHPSIPFGREPASGSARVPDWQKCFPVFSHQLSQISFIQRILLWKHCVFVFNWRNTAGRAKAWLCPQVDLCSDSNPPSLSFAFSTQALPWRKGNSGICPAETYLIFKI